MKKQRLNLDTLDFNEIENVILENVDIEDYPDFSISFILSADYRGDKLSDEELDMLNDVGFVSWYLFENNFF